MAVAKRRTTSQPKSRSRAKPGAGGGGAFFHIEVRPRREFKTFRTQDGGSWDTQKWLVSKEHAHREGRRLVADTADARKILKALGAAPTHLNGDRFKAKDRPNVPERRKPTQPMRRARTSNIRKAQAARRKTAR